MNKPKKPRARTGKPKTEREKVMAQTERLIKQVRELQDHPLADQVPFLRRSK